MTSQSDILDDTPLGPLPSLPLICYIYLYAVDNPIQLIQPVTGETSDVCLAQSIVLHQI